MSYKCDVSDHEDPIISSRNVAPPQISAQSSEPKADSRLSSGNKMESHPLTPPLQSSASPRLLEPDDNDLDKLRKWQEDRISKKLRGEYESAVLHLSEVVSFYSLTLETRKLKSFLSIGEQ